MVFWGLQKLYLPDDGLVYRSGDVMPFTQRYKNTVQEIYFGLFTSFYVIKH